MKLGKKLYTVTIGLTDDGEGAEVASWSNKTVIATNASEAISRARLKAKEYPESVTLIANIDVP